MKLLVLLRPIPVATNSNQGFTIKDGEEYVIVNDPAAKEVETVRREYKVSEFERAWNRIIYVLVPELD